MQTPDQPNQPDTDTAPAAPANLADGAADAAADPGVDPQQVKEQALRKSHELLQAARAEQTRAARVAQRRGMEHPRRTPLKTLDQSSKMKNVLYDIRGPVSTLAEQMEADGHRIMMLNTGNPAKFGSIS